MRGRIDRVLEYFTAEPLRVSAWLRLPLIGLIVVLVSIADIDPWFPAAYWAVLAAYIVSALVWVVIAVRGHAGRGPRRWPPPSTYWRCSHCASRTDHRRRTYCRCCSCCRSRWRSKIAPASPRSSESSRPQAISGCGSSTRSGTTPWGCRTRSYLYFGLFLWLAAATTALCFVLTRRSARVNALLDVRRRLVSESMSADDRHNRELAEQLHDGPLQNLLAARLELDEVRERHADPALDAVESALHDTTTEAAHNRHGVTPAGACRTGARRSAAGVGAAVRTSLRDRGRPRRGWPAAVAVRVVSGGP